MYAFLLENWRILRFSPPVRYDGKPAGSVNPKRMQRAIQKQMSRQGAGTKSQQAQKLQHEEGKTARRAKTRAQKEAEAQRRFEIKRQKRKEKHRGR